ARRLAASGRRADLMVANNVLAHAPATRDFVGGFAELLAPEGVATFEFPHLLNLIDEVQFDTIYHEHFFYLSFLCVERMMGAAAKGATFLNVCGVGYPEIEAVYDRSAEKQGRLTPGSHIPILAPERIEELRPDDIVILPWNLADEIVRSLPRVREWGGRFVVA